MGEIFALATALVWSVAVILFRKSGETVPPLALNLFRVGLSSALFAVLLLVTGRPLLRMAPWQDYAILVASGIIAIALSDTLFHMCLNRVGAGVSAIVDTLYAPLIVLCAWLMLDERLGPWQLWGMALVVLAVLVATQVTPPQGVERRTLISGILIGVGAMVSLSFGIVLAKPVLNHSDVIWATTVRQFGSLLVLVPLTLIHPQRRRLWSVFRPQAAWRYSVPGTVMGSFLALLLWIAGMKFTQAGIAAILNQTSTIYILILASVFLKEPFSWRRGLSVGLALGGIALVLRPALP